GVFDEGSTIWNFSLPMMLNGFLCVPTIWICNALLARCPDGYQNLGAYNAGYQFRIVVIQLPIIIQTCFAPLLSEAYGKRLWSHFRKQFDIGFWFVWVCALI